MNTAKKKCCKIVLIGFMLILGVIVPQQIRAKTTKKPNILIIFGDDIGQSNIRAYTHVWWDTKHQILTVLQKKE